MYMFLHRRGQAEVQAVFSDGAVSLHTRSLKYGKVSWAVVLLFADRHFRSIFESPKCSGTLTQRSPELSIMGRPPTDRLIPRVRGQERCHRWQLLSSTEEAPVRGPCDPVPRPCSALSQWALGPGREAAWEPGRSWPDEPGCLSR